MIKLYLAWNAVIYAVFAVWCTLAPRQTADFVGLKPISAAGEAEYLAIYGGLQAGLAAFYGLALFLPQHRQGALLMSLALYGGLVLFRGAAVLRSGFAELGSARWLFCLEIALLLAALLLVVRRPS